MPAPENVKWYFQFLIHSAFAQLAVDIDQNLQRHRAVSLRQHGFLVISIIDVLSQLNADPKFWRDQHWRGIKMAIFNQTLPYIENGSRKLYTGRLSLDEIERWGWAEINEIGSVCRQLNSNRMIEGVLSIAPFYSCTKSAIQLLYWRLCSRSLDVMCNCKLCACLYFNNYTLILWLAYKLWPDY